MTLNPIRGAERIARFFIGTARKFGPAVPDLRIEMGSVDGVPAIIALSGGQIAQIMTLSVAAERIAALYVIRNPDKLGHLRPAGATAEG